MNPTNGRSRSRVRGVLASVALVVAACGGDPSPSLGARPTSPAKVEVVQPESGATLQGDSVHVVLKLDGATIVPETTTSLRPDEGHVHLYLNNQLVSMNYGLEQDVPVQPGTFAIKAEFVAADHAPFSPRVWSSETVVTVRP